MINIPSSRLAVAAVALTSAFAGFGGVAGAATTHKSTNKHGKHATKSSKSTTSTTSSTAADYPGSSSGTGTHQSRETELTGDTAAKAKAAALAAVPGGTVGRASTEDADEGTNAAYEVHVTKSDGSEVEVLLDSDFNLLKVQASGRGGRGGHGGGCSHDDSSSDTTAGTYPGTYPSST